MKKNVIASILGIAVVIGTAATSYGQGQVFFDNYDASPYYNVKYGAGTAAGADVSVELGYALGVGQTTGFTLIPGSITTINPNLSQANGGVGAPVGGWFQGPVVTIPGATAGLAVTFEMLAWTTDGGTSFDNAAYNGSMIWTELGSSLGGNGNPASNFTALPGSLILVPTPEPATLALVGLGGLASLVAFRRKQA